MKLSVNRNIVWCELFIQRLVELGVKYACISPGSRSTPLTLAITSNNSVEAFSIVDERSSAFFALGLAKQTKTPVVILTTSGTAVAEIYPAIIEAHYQRVPLIVCTADRPPILRGKGANQTINQHNIYRNHIRLFKDIGLPDLNKLPYIKAIAEEAIEIALYKNKGPVHLNFPFEKPFEPRSYTDKIDISKLEKFLKSSSISKKYVRYPSSLPVSLINKLLKKPKGLILVGYNNYDEEFENYVIQFSEKFGYPIYADGASPIRFGKHPKDNIIDNLSAIVRSKNFLTKLDPEIIIHFGGAPTANVLLEFYKNSKAEKILVNEYGDWNDPSLTAKQIIKMNPTAYCANLISKTKNKAPHNCRWLDDYKNLNSISRSLKEFQIEKEKFPFEGRIVNEVLRSLPNKCNLVISNSLPIRDFDFFASCSNKEINIFTNRGASGIDGINSTAIGIARASKLPTYLLIGDLAFYHDMNGLINSIKYNVPLAIILINNNGGGIFESLPIAEYKEVLQNHFITPLHLDFKKFVNAFGGNYIRVRNWNQFSKELILSSTSTSFTVLEIKTDAKQSKLRRQKYWSSVTSQIEKYIDEIIR